MDSLPLELLDYVLDNIPYYWDLLPMRRISRVFCYLVTPRVFRQVRFRNTFESIAEFNEISECRNLAQFVKEIRFRIAGTSWDGYLSYDQRSKDDHPVVLPQGFFEPITAMETQLASAFYKIDIFPNLRALSIVFAPVEDDYLSNLRRQLLIFSILYGVELHSLKSLTINNHIALPAQLYWDPDFFCLFNSLSHLHLSVLPQCDGGLEHHGDFWVEAVQLRILRRVSLSQCLVSLSLRSVSDDYDDPMGFAIPFSFRGVDLPLVASFSLKYFLLGDGDCDGIDFIRRHASTLRTLELNRCPLLLPSTGPLRFWSGIWNCFSEELKALTSLQVDDDEGFDMYGLEKDSWYEIIRYGSSEFTKDLPELPDQKEDDRALEGLKALVLSRRRP